MNCLHCQTNSPRYTFTQLCCCIRLVRNSRPMRSKQEGMLEVIEKTPGSPERKDILEGMKNE